MYLEPGSIPTLLNKSAQRKTYEDYYKQIGKVRRKIYSAYQKDPLYRSGNMSLKLHYIANVHQVRKWVVRKYDMQSCGPWPGPTVGYGCASMTRLFPCRDLGLAISVEQGLFAVKCPLVRASQDLYISGWV